MNEKLEVKLLVSNLSLLLTRMTYKLRHDDYKGALALGNQGVEFLQSNGLMSALRDDIDFRPKPIDMVLHCPACGEQHVDAPEPAQPRHYDELPGGMAEAQAWTNPPHRSHRCHGCGHIWRPADVPTNGVWAVKTKGKNDSRFIVGELLEVKKLHEITRAIHDRIAAAITSAQPGQQPALGERLRRRCLDWGAYWRASDSQGVSLTADQAVELLRDALGVEVELVASAQPTQQEAQEFTVEPEPKDGTQD